MASIRERLDTDTIATDSDPAYEYRLVRIDDEQRFDWRGAGQMLAGWELVVAFSDSGYGRPESGCSAVYRRPRDNQ